MFFPFRDDNPTSRPATVTYALVAINVAALLWLNRLPEIQQVAAVYQWGFVPARIAQLTSGKPIQVRVPEVVAGPWGMAIERDRVLVLRPNTRVTLLSLVTAMFLHGGWMHLIGNMWFLAVFGNNVEDRLGHVPYLGFYLVGGLAANAFHWAGQPMAATPVIGASGAVAAVLGAYAITWPWARVRTLVFLLFFITILDFPALLVLGVWFVTQLLNATRQAAGAGANVAWWAHVGGFLAGAMLMPLMNALFDTRRTPPSGPFPVPDSNPDRSF
jgi:membrane associated rhomboid family serine protease